MPYLTKRKKVRSEVNTQVYTGPHNSLAGRPALNCHPIQSITGLQAELDKITGRQWSIADGYSPNMQDYRLSAGILQLAETEFSPGAPNVSYKSISLGEAPTPAGSFFSGEESWQDDPVFGSGLVRYSGITGDPAGGGFSYMVLLGTGGQILHRFKGDVETIFGKYSAPLSSFNVTTTARNPLATLDSVNSNTGRLQLYAGPDPYTIIPAQFGDSAGISIDQILQASGYYIGDSLVNIPAGGTAGQSLRKTSDDDYDVAWENLSSSDISDFQTAVRGLLSAESPIAYNSSTGAISHVDNSSIRHVTDEQIDSWTGLVDGGPYLPTAGGTVGFLNVDNNLTVGGYFRLDNGRSEPFGSLGGSAIYRASGSGQTGLEGNLVYQSRTTTGRGHLWYTGGPTLAMSLLGTSGLRCYHNLQVDNDLTVSGATILPSDDYIYWGSPTVNGSYRQGRDGNNLITQRRESGAWVTKQTLTP